MFEIQGRLSKMKELNDLKICIMVDVLSFGGCMSDILQGFSCTAELKCDYEKRNTFSNNTDC